MQQPTELRWVSFVVLERGKIFFFNKNGIAYSPGEIRHDHLPSRGKKCSILPTITILHLRGTDLEPMS